MTMETLSEIDREALTRALELARSESERERARLDSIEQEKGWHEAATRAVYGLQCRSLGLKPWQAPPMEARDAVNPAGGYGRTRKEVMLRRRLLAAGLSKFEPDPLGALERVERARQDERVVEPQRA
jgi:hypothetical protein